MISNSVLSGMKKIALVSTALPPSQSGQSTVLFHLLKNLDPRKYCLITQKNVHLYSIKPRGSSQLPVNYHFFPPDYQVIRVFTHTASMVQSTALLNLILKIRIHQIKKVLQEEHCDAIVACTGDLFDPPAAFLASRDFGIPFILYTFDYYSCQWTNPFLRSFARRFEPDLVRDATKVIVPNECMHEEYLKQYGIVATIIHNPFDLGDYEKQAQNVSEPNNRPIEKTIVYTGTIYDAHYDAFRNLITAMQSLGIQNLKIHLYTPQSQRNLTENNIIGPVVVHEAQPVTAIPAIQRSADILFLPLSFRSQFPEVIKTSAPGKIGEYLASKRPILVHAPKDSFVSWYFRKYHCGLVVDQDNPQLLAKAIERLLKDTQLQQTLSENAYSRAIEDFDIHNAQKKFKTTVGL